MYRLQSAMKWESIAVRAMIHFIVFVSFFYGKIETEYFIFTIVSTPCFEFNELDFESESNELELACFDAEL